MYHELLYFLSIVFMVFVIFVLASMIAGMRYSLYTCFARVIFWGDYKCLNWLVKNYRYIFYHVFIVAIIGIGLSNLGQMIKNDIFTRTAFVQHAQPIFWMCIIYIVLDYKRVYDILNLR